MESVKSPVRRSCALGLVLVLICTQGFSAAEGSAIPLTVDLRLEESRPLQKDCYGANLQLHHGPIWFDHPDLAGKYIESGKPFFRFPGGTAANFYNPETGLMDEDAPSHHNYKKLNENILSKTDGKGDTPAEFFEFAGKTGSRYSVVLNVCTRTLEQNRKWLEELRTQGIEISCFEIGNEVYFGTYAWAFPEPRDYVRRARASARMIHEVFPRAKVGVVVPSQIYTDEVFLEGRRSTLPKRQQEWMSLLEKESFFDAVIIHLYSSLGMNKQVEEEDLLPFAESYSNVVTYAERHLDPSLDLLETKFPGKEIWITEYGVGGFRGALRSYGLRHSNLGCLHSDLMLLRFLSRPSITISSWHSFSQCIAYDQKRGGILEEPTIQFYHLSLFADPVNHSDSYVPVKFTDGAQLEVGAFTGGRKGYIMVLNKREKSYQLESVTAEKGLRLTSAIQLSPRKGIPLAEALESSTLMERSTLTGEMLKSVAFPPYSITRIEFEWE